MEVCRQHQDLAVTEGVGCS